MRITLLLICILLLLSACQAQVPDEHASRYMKRCQDYLVKDSSLFAWFTLDEMGISMYSSPEAKLKDSVEFKLSWDKVDAFQDGTRRLPYDSLNAWYVNGKLMQQIETGENQVGVERQADRPKPLAGMRIALDPGHVGGTLEMGMLEWKYIRIRPDRQNGIRDTISFNEGNLALATALILDSMFREAGAEVLITRRREGETAFGYDFATWLDSMQVAWEVKSGWKYWGPMDDSKAFERYRIRCAANIHLEKFPELKPDSLWWMNKSNMVSVYKGPFLRAEFEQRARLIHDFQPDLSLIIHYNVLETNEPGPDGFRAAVNDNFCMAFVPGAYMKGELDKPEDRLAFLIKLLSDDQAKSVALCDAILAQHEEKLGVPRLPATSPMGYIVNASILMPEAKAVYARNLALTRKIHGVMCFGESLYQDNLKECAALNAKDFVLPGMTTPMPNRVREVAKAYFDGVLAWKEGQK